MQGRTHIATSWCLHQCAVMHRRAIDVSRMGAGGSTAGTGHSLGEERAPISSPQPPPPFCAQHEAESKRRRALQCFSAGTTLVRSWGSCQAWGGSKEERSFQTAIIKQSQKADFRRIRSEHRKLFMNLSCSLSQQTEHWVHCTWSGYFTTTGICTTCCEERGCARQEDFCHAKVEGREKM